MAFVCFVVLGTEHRLKIEFSFRRNPAPTLLTTWLPSCLAVMVAWAGLWLSGAGLFLPSAALVCVSVYADHFKSQLKGHALLTAMDVWLLVCLVFIFAAFVQHTVSRSKVGATKTTMTKNKSFMK